MSGSVWRDLLWRAAWGNMFGRALTFAVVAVAAGATVHRGGTNFDLWVPLVGSTGGWAVSLVRWPPDARS